jgi:hypothetical protein
MKRGMVAVALMVVVLGMAVPYQPMAAEEIEPEPFPFSDRYPAEIALRSAEMLETLVRLGIDIGNVRPLDPDQGFPAAGAPFELLVATVYVSPAEERLLEALGMEVRPIPNESVRAFREYGPGSGAPDAWPTYEDFVARMQGIADTYPDLVRMVSIGQSVLGREIWMLKISDNPDEEEDEPELKYTSTVHGNEGVGTEMTIRLAELLTESYDVDPDLTELVNEMEIWLCPIHNPDGYVAGNRYNANGVDLNRDFPDRITDPFDDPAGREPETQAFMYFGYDHRFVMGANYHTGALVVNVPWDSIIEGFPEYAPDDEIFIEYGIGYAERNPMIWNGGFPNGITRGWEWYIIRGGMQDWAYHWQGEHHVTIENSSQQPPPYNQMDTYWDAEREAMIWWMGRALTGVRGLVTDAFSGAPLDAMVDVVQIGKPVRTDPDVGDYHRLLLPGTYTITCAVEGYVPQVWAVEVISGTATVQDCALDRVSPYGVEASSSEAMGEPGSIITHTLAITNVGVVSDSYSLALTPGGWPASLLDEQVGPLEPLGVGYVQVEVEVPTRPVEVSDLFSLTVTSVASSAVGVETYGISHALIEAGIELIVVGPDSQGGAAGAVVGYQLVLTNTGNTSDECSITTDEESWPVVVSPTQVVLAPAAGASLFVWVTVPDGPVGESDTVVVRGTSGWDGEVYAEQPLVTMRLRGLFLPVVLR